LIKKILTEIGCHHIDKKRVNQKEVITAANKDGDNLTAINVFLDNFLVICLYYPTHIVVF
jgi:hypothetical protein